MNGRERGYVVGGCVGSGSCEGVGTRGPSALAVGDPREIVGERDGTGLGAMVAP